MSILEKYVEVFNLNDAKKFAEMFDKDCIFHDTAPTKVGMDALYIVGSEAVEMIFKQNFAAMKMSGKVIKIEGNVMDYDLQFGDAAMPCQGTLLEEKDGKIASYFVKFREQ